MSQATEGRNDMISFESESNPIIIMVYSNKLVPSKYKLQYVGGKPPERYERGGKPLNFFPSSELID